MWSAKILWLGFLSIWFGCGSKDARFATTEAYAPVPTENMVMLLADSNTSVQSLTQSLARYQNSFVNTICVFEPNERDFKTLVDSCHRLGVNVMVQTSNDTRWNDRWITAANADGFIVPHVHNERMDQWQTRIDSMNALKPVVAIVQHGNDALKEAGFVAAFANEFALAVNAVITGQSPLRTLDSAIAGEEFYFTRQFPAIRYAPSLPHDFPNRNAAQLAALLTTWVMPGIPAVRQSDLHALGDSVGRFFQVHSASPVLQYGNLILFNDSTSNVLIGVREFQGTHLMFAINMHNQPAEYRWPTHLVGIKTQVAFGEKITREGGQELPPYGYQMLVFDHVRGYDMLEFRAGAGIR